MSGSAYATKNGCRIDIADEATEEDARLRQKFLDAALAVCKKSGGEMMGSFDFGEFDDGRPELFLYDAAEQAKLPQRAEEECWTPAEVRKMLACYPALREQEDSEDKADYEQYLYEYWSAYNFLEVCVEEELGIGFSE